MAEQMIVKCRCGQDNHLVKIGGIWRYDEHKHGNGEDSKLVCFNCFAPLKGKDIDTERKAAARAEAAVEIARKKAADIASAKVAKEAAGSATGAKAAEASGDADNDANDLDKMSKKELHTLAEQLQIDVPGNLGKKKLIKRIEEFQAKNTEANEVKTNELDTD
ncbi:MAG: hypothetical protein GWO86_02940 [Planctomycetes bacterium]|nr:hypothetical protein [Planctomycetota bacterium]